MDCVQGTVVVVDFEVQDPDTGALKDPTDVVVTVFPPGLPKYLISYVGGEITKQGVGSYRFLLNTTPAPGQWRYEVDAKGAEEVVKQRKIRVNPRWTT